MKKLLSAAALMAALFTTSCGGDDDTKPSVDCGADIPTYLSAVKFVLDAKCATVGCHDAATKANGFDMSTYAGAKAVATAKKADLLGAINQESGFEKMPQTGDKLSDAEIKVITCWANNGAPE